MVAGKIPWKLCIFHTDVCNIEVNQQGYMLSDGLCPLCIMWEYHVLEQNYTFGLRLWKRLEE